MGQTYTRQSSYTDGDVITAAHTNDEFNQLLAAFASSTGHTHDGTTAEGGPITKLLGTSITIGDGTSGTDITVTFDGETNDGTLKWMEDEDYFEFSDDILIASTEKLQFRDTAIYINSSADGQLDLVADTEIQIAATTVDINGAVDISGNLTVGGSVIIGGNTLSSTELLFLDGVTAGTVTATIDGNIAQLDDLSTNTSQTATCALTITVADVVTVTSGKAVVDATSVGTVDFSAAGLTDTLANCIDTGAIHGDLTAIKNKDGDININLGTINTITADQITHLNLAFFAILEIVAITSSASTPSISISGEPMERQIDLTGTSCSLSSSGIGGLFALYSE